MRQTKSESNTRFRFWPHFWKSLAAILAGNAIYFLALSPRLPPSARHLPGRLDLGLLIDFWVCLVCFGLLTLLKFIDRMDARRR